MVLILGGLPAVAQSLEGREVKFTVPSSESLHVSYSRTGNHIDRVLVRAGSGENSKCASFFSDASMPGLFLYQGQNSANDRVVIVSSTCEDCGDPDCPEGQVPVQDCEPFEDAIQDTSGNCVGGPGSCMECETICVTPGPTPDPQTPNCTSLWGGFSTIFLDQILCAFGPAGSGGCNTNTNCQ
jgi:hypothetical protein